MLGLKWYWEVSFVFYISSKYIYILYIRAFHIGLKLKLCMSYVWAGTCMIELKAQIAPSVDERYWTGSLEKSITIIFIVSTTFGWQKYWGQQFLRSDALFDKIHKRLQHTKVSWKLYLQDCCVISFGCVPYSVILDAWRKAFSHLLSRQCLSCVKEVGDPLDGRCWTGSLCHLWNCPPMGS